MRQGTVHGVPKGRSDGSTAIGSAFDRKVTVVPIRPLAPINAIRTISPLPRVFALSSRSAGKPNPAESERRGTSIARVPLDDTSTAELTGYLSSGVPDNANTS